MSLYIQYGCHHNAPTEWLNFDASPTLLMERLPFVGKLVHKNARRFPLNVKYGDIVRGLPVLPNSADGVYCSHVLEHLALEDCRRAMLNTYSMMKIGGVFRLVLPDIEQYIKNYASSVELSTRAETFMVQTGLGQSKRPRDVYSKIIESFGNSQHRWMWDFAFLSRELNHLGFRSIRRAIFEDAEDTMFGLVEVKERWDNALGIECKK